MGNDHSPYRVRVGDRIELEEPVVFGRETNLVEIPISWSLDDFVYFEYLKTPTTVTPDAVTPSTVTPNTITPCTVAFSTVMPGLMNANNVLENWTNDFEYMTRMFERRLPRKQAVEKRRT